jgi:hypothetical protein
MEKDWITDLDKKETVLKRLKNKKTVEDEADNSKQTVED